MNPIVKKAGAALAIKEIVDRVRESREPKRSAFARLGPKFLIVGLIGATAYIVKSGRLDGLLGRGGRDDLTAPTPYETGPTIDVREAPTSDETRSLEGSALAEHGTQV